MRELSRKLKDEIQRFRKLGAVCITSVDLDQLEEIADLLDPPQYSCNGELVEFVDEDGCKGHGVAGKYGIQCYCDIAYWEDITDYRVIREAKEFMSHPDDWPLGACEILFEPSYYDTGGQLVTVGPVKELTREEAEEMHKELK